MPSGLAKSNGRCRKCGARNKITKWSRICYVCGSTDLEIRKCDICHEPIALGEHCTWAPRGLGWEKHTRCLDKNDDTKYEQSKHQDDLNESGDSTMSLDSFDVLTADVVVDEEETKEVIPVTTTTAKSLRCESIYDSIYLLIQARIPFYIYGPAGCGKSHICEEAANRLGMEFRSISLNVMTMPSALLGFIDAGGTYRGTDFRYIYEHGGAFLFDELDNAAGNLLSSLNSGVANRFLQFPDGMIRMHPDCVIIATGNTTGRGKTAQYISRQTLDAATLDRFVYLAHTYDEKLEMTLASMAEMNGHCKGKVDYQECMDSKLRTAWCAIVQSIRRNAQNHGLQVVVSMRPVVVGCKLLNHYTFADLAEMLICKGTDGDTRAKLVQGVAL